jgi:hypothetical protein
VRVSFSLSILCLSRSLALDSGYPLAYMPPHPAAGMLSNLLFSGRLIKAAVLASSIPTTLEAVWGVCVLDGRLLQTLLDSLCNLVAGSTNTCTNPTAGDGGRAGGGVNGLALPATNQANLLRRCSKLACRLLRTNTKESLVRSLFEFFSAVVLNNDCRAAMWREGLLDECLVQLSTRRRLHPGLLPFLSCASFCKDTQTALCRSTLLLAVVVEHTHTHTTSRTPNTSASASATHRRTQLAATTILANVCTLRQARAMIAGNTAFVTILRQLACSTDSAVQAAAQEALWSLLRHSNKTDRRKMWPQVQGVLQQQQHARQHREQEKEEHGGNSGGHEEQVHSHAHHHYNDLAAPPVAPAGSAY